MKNESAMTTWPDCRAYRGTLTYLTLADETGTRALPLAFCRETESQKPLSHCPGVTYGICRDQESPSDSQPFATSIEELEPTTLTTSSLS